MIHNKFYIKDEFRKNPKSLIPGGWDVEVEFKSGEIRIYSNIKDTERYANYIITKDPNVKSVKVIGHSKKD
ncbi:hypothetical protein OAC86_00865 [bacterium]|nr:hypothetical protein [bacterium]MDB9900075.1 hypothetical protein [bacterium]